MQTRRSQRDVARHVRAHPGDALHVAIERFDAHDVRVPVSIDECDIGIVRSHDEACGGNALQATREWRRREARRGADGRIGKFVATDRIEAHRFACDDAVELAEGDVGDIADCKRTIVKTFGGNRLTHACAHGALHEFRRLPDKREPFVHHLHGVMVRRPWASTLAHPR